MNVVPKILIDLHTGPLPPQPQPSVADCGAVVSFDGVVRPRENERRLRGLDYEQYPPMTASELKRLAAEVARKHGLHLMTIRHSVGFVPVEATSFRLVVAAPHRAQALAAMSEFIDRMKQEVPLWKVPLFAD